MKIVTAVVNNPTFIEIQYHTLKKYFKGDYEFIVFNDAKDFPDMTNGNDVTIKAKIETTCQNLGIRCINIPNEDHKQMNMSTRHADTFNNHVLMFQKQNPDKYLLLDSDMFLIDTFDIEKYSNYDCAIVLQSRNNYSLNYIWPGLFYVDFSKIQNIELLDWRPTDYCDTGGMMKEWLQLQMNGSNMPNTDEIRWTDKKFHNETIYFIKHLWGSSWDETELPTNLQERHNIIDFLNQDVRNENNKFFCEIYDDVFLHYRAGSNWNGEGMELHNCLTNLLKKVLMD